MRARTTLIVLLVMWAGLLAREGVAQGEALPPAAPASEDVDVPRVRSPVAPESMPSTLETVRQAVREATRDKTSGDGVTAVLEETDAYAVGAAARRRSLFAPLRRWKRCLQDRWNLDVALAYTALYQHATQARGARDAAAGDFDLYATWQPIGRKRCNAGSFSLHLEGRHRIGTPMTPFELGDGIGTLVGTTITFNTQPFIPKQYYWQQEFLRGKAQATAGVLDPSTWFFGTRATDQNTLFQHALFSDAPAVSYPSAGLGVVLRYEPNRCWKVLACLSDANGGRSDNPYADFGIGEFFTALEVTYRREFRHLGLGNFRVGAWGADPREQADKNAGWGYALSLDQELGEDWVVFAQHTFSPSDLTGTRLTLTGGFGVWDPIQARADDLLGFGFGWARPEDRRLRDEFAGEFFYRIQVTPDIQLTPSAQLILFPANNPTLDVVGVFGLRFRLSL